MILILTLFKIIIMYTFLHTNYPECLKGSGTQRLLSGYTWRQLRQFFLRSAVVPTQKITKSDPMIGCHMLEASLATIRSCIVARRCATLCHLPSYIPRMYIPIVPLPRGNRKSSNHQIVPPPSSLLDVLSSFLKMKQRDNKQLFPTD